MYLYVCGWERQFLGNTNKELEYFSDIIKQILYPWLFSILLSIKDNTQTTRSVQGFPVLYRVIHYNYSCQIVANLDNAVNTFVLCSFLMTFLFDLSCVASFHYKRPWKNNTLIKFYLLSLISETSRRPLKCSGGHLCCSKNVGSKDTNTELM